MADKVTLCSSLLASTPPLLRLSSVKLPHAVSQRSGPCLVLQGSLTQVNPTTCIGGTLPSLCKVGPVRTDVSLVLF